MPKDEDREEKDVRVRGHHVSSIVECLIATATFMSATRFLGALLVFM